MSDEAFLRMAREGSLTEAVAEAERARASEARLLEALKHMQWCQPCALGSWGDCEGGRDALAAISAAEGPRDG